MAKSQFKQTSFEFWVSNWMCMYEGCSIKTRSDGAAFIDCLYKLKIFHHHNHKAWRIMAFAVAFDIHLLRWITNSSSSLVYSLLWILTNSVNFFHSSLSAHAVFQSFTPMTIVSSSIPAFQLLLGLPIVLGLCLSILFFFLCYGCRFHTASNDWP